MARYKVNLVHFVEADSADAAIEVARSQCQSPVIGEAFLWGSLLTATAPETDSQPQPGANKSDGARGPSSLG